MQPDRSGEGPGLVQVQAAHAGVVYSQWICKVCAWVYDEALGDEEHGLSPGTVFADIPEDWYCPECGVTKADFELFEA